MAACLSFHHLRVLVVKLGSGYLREHAMKNEQKYIYLYQPSIRASNEVFFHPDTEIHLMLASIP